MATNSPNPTDRDHPPIEGEVVLTAPVGRCPACGYELHGCPVVREPHYGLLILRCPECGHISTPLDQHAGGRTIKREKRVAFLWWLLLPIVILGPAAALAGLAQSTAFATSAPYAVAIAEAYHATPEGAAEYPHPPSIFCSISDAFAATINSTTAGGWRVNLNYLALTDLLYAVPISFVMASLWACLFPHLRRRALLALAVAAVLVGGAALLIYYRVPTLPRSGQYAYRIAEDLVGIWIGLVSFAVCAAIFLAFVAIARPITRRLVAVLAPPRTRLSLRALWTADGLPPPPPGSAPS